MEARRTFVDAKSYKQLWIILAGVLVAAMLTIGAAFLTSGVASNGASKAPYVGHPAPGTVLRQDAGSSKAPTVYSPKHRQTQF